MLVTRPSRLGVVWSTKTHHYMTKYFDLSSRNIFHPGVSTVSILPDVTFRTRKLLSLSRYIHTLTSGLGMRVNVGATHFHFIFIRSRCSGMVGGSRWAVIVLNHSDFVIFYIFYCIINCLIVVSSRYWAMSSWWWPVRSIKVVNLGQPTQILNIDTGVTVVASIESLLACDEKLKTCHSSTFFADIVVRSS